MITFNTNSPLLQNNASLQINNFAQSTARAAMRPADAAIAAARESFQSRFSQLASNKNEFYNLIQTAFGGQVDVTKAEQLRQRALDGDFSWIPKITVLNDAEMNGAQGGYDKDSQTIFINANILSDPSLVSSVISEEIGHHIDHIINPTDAAGDEGEIFRRMLGGEKLSTQQLNELRAENDHGFVTINGQTREVENFSFGKIFGGIAKAVGSVFSGVTKAVGGVVGGITNAIGSVVGKVTNFAGSILGPVAAPFGDLFGKAVNFIKKGAGTILNKVTKALGPIGKFIKKALPIITTVGSFFIPGGFLLKAGGLLSKLGSVGNLVAGAGKFLGVAEKIGKFGGMVANYGTKAAGILGKLGQVGNYIKPFVETAVKYGSKVMNFTDRWVGRVRDWIGLGKDVYELVNPQADQPQPRDNNNIQPTQPCPVDPRMVINPDEWLRLQLLRERELQLLEI